MTGGAHVDVGADRWELTFSQPASDYLEFRNRLDQQNLSLENVVLREADQQLVGSIKVKKKHLISTHFHVQFTVLTLDGVGRPFHFNQFN